MSKSLKTTVIATAAVLATLVGAAQSANAHHKKHKFGLIIGPPAHDCEFYYWKWQTTGKPKWQYRYYQCMGWW